MCRAANEPGGPRRCPCSDRPRPRYRAKADNAGRKQISRCKQAIAQLTAANPALEQVISAQTAITVPGSDVIKQLRAARSRARQAGDADAVQVIDAQLAAAQLVIAQHRLAEARAEAHGEDQADTAATANASEPSTRPQAYEATVPEPRAAVDATPAPTPIAPSTTTLQDAIYATGATVRKGDWMPLSKLRSMMPADASREEVDAMLKQLCRDGKIHLAPDPRKDSLSQADHNDALRLGGEANHLVSWEAEARVPTSAATQAKPPRQSPVAGAASPLEDTLRAVAKGEHQGDWMPLSKLRSMMPADASREEVDAMLKQLSRDGKIVLAPNPDRKSLDRADRENAIRAGGEDNHLVAFTASWVQGKAKVDPEAALQRILASGVTADTPSEDLEAARSARSITADVGRAIYAERHRREQAARQSAGTSASAAGATDPAPSGAAGIAARLRELPNEDEGATFLRARGLDRKGLQAVAAELGLTRVGRLGRDALEQRVLKQAIGARNKFAGLRDWSPTDTTKVQETTIQPCAKAEPSPAPAGKQASRPAANTRTATHVAKPATTATPAPTKPTTIEGTIAARLRDISTEQDGATYLRSQNLDRKGLQAVAAELGLTRVGRLGRDALEQRVLKQAIGARNKFAGLREGWQGTRKEQQGEPRTVHEAIRAAYEVGVKPGSLDRMQRLADVRARIDARFSREEVDAALGEMGRSGAATLAPNPARRNVTAEDHAAAVWIGGDENDLIAFEDFDD